MPSELDLPDLPDPTVLIKLHGTFMVIAWILFSSVGGAVARYFKKTWVTEQYFGGDAWFLYHRMYMFFTWLLTCSGFIIIFIDMDGWQDTAHAILGTITFVLCFLQPILGAASPARQPRKIVRFFHILSGNVSYYLAVINMFLAVGLKSANLPEALYGWIAGGLALHLLAHGAFNVLDYMTRKKTADHPMLDPTKDASYSRWRKLTLMTQIIGLLAFTIVIVVLIWHE
ncbi:putative ferric-chelate reductase 1 homolog [Malaya genurostris]|uniref:putative ferric-chelate reductase 1 homolog n=1 Tax=Malaya genurostris TaxID=325434 RepID=UPI0026F3DA50|nr:putative ferric-chelate reductase 1 homolog [Malaya genurostris]